MASPTSSSRISAPSKDQGSAAAKAPLAKASPLKQALRGASFAEGAAMLTPADGTGAKDKSPSSPSAKREFPERFAHDQAMALATLAAPDEVVTGLVLDVAGLALGSGTARDAIVGEGVHEPRENGKEIRVQGSLASIPWTQLINPPDVGKNPLRVRAKAIGQHKKQEILLEATQSSLIEDADRWKGSGFLAAKRVAVSDE